MGAVGAKDWAGGFLDLTADLQDDTFVGNKPLTPEARAGYLGECLSSTLGSFGFKDQRVALTDFQKDK